MDKKTLMQAGFKGKGKTFTRATNDIIQLINFQSSNYSEEVYINVAIWPLALGEPSCLVEHKFPLRGRIEDFVDIKGNSSDKAAEAILEALNGPLSSLERLQEQSSLGRLESIYLSQEARKLLEPK